jgi:hypothetical protein
MCVACAAAGKAAGGTGCADAAPSNDDAPQPGSGGAAYESAGTDTVAGSASTSSTLSIDSSVRGYVNAAGDQDWYRVDPSR